MKNKELVHLIQLFKNRVARVAKMGCPTRPNPAHYRLVI